MIKFVVAAIWLCAATVGAVVFAFQSAGARPEDPAAAEATMMGGLDYVKTEVMSVPLIRSGNVEGYFLSRLVYTVDPKELAKLKVPIDAVITDVVYSYIYTSPELDFTKAKLLDIDAFRKGIRERINAKVKYDLVRDVLVEQVDYLTRAEIRDNAIKRRQVGKRPSAVSAPAAEHAEPAAH
jgi:hypothetical protein